MAKEGTLEALGIPSCSHQRVAGTAGATSKSAPSALAAAEPLLTVEPAARRLACLLLVPVPDTTSDVKISCKSIPRSGSVDPRNEMCVPCARTTIRRMHVPDTCRVIHIYRAISCYVARMSAFFTIALVPRLHLMPFSTPGVL